ncbi:hypothetical protein [Streptomyces sp. NBC_00035]|uniref:hypothetical protein n=1 Tax=Streptomyces sp. NBC_00035 TaxID=2903614 RepID=UPI003245D750
MAPGLGHGAAASRRYSYPEAAAALDVEEAWLRRNIGQLPHSRLGRVVQFSAVHLELIGAKLQSPGTG